MISPNSINAFGKKTILIEWSSNISSEIHIAVMSYESWINKKLGNSLIETVPSYTSLTLYLKDPMELDEIIEDLKYSTPEKTEYVSNHWSIPVCYDPSFGIDLETISNKNQITVEEIIQLHSSTQYRLYFHGFLPGFMYLGGLHKKLHFPRKDSPRLKIPKGSVAIGGEQTGVYPSESPGGWNLIGRTPIEMFEVKKHPPVPMSAGDIISFYPITLREFENRSHNTFELKKLGKS